MWRGRGKSSGRGGGQWGRCGRLELGMLGVVVLIIVFVSVVAEMVLVMAHRRLIQEHQIT